MEGVDIFFVICGGGAKEIKGPKNLQILALILAAFTIRTQIRVNSKLRKGNQTCRLLTQSFIAHIMYLFKVFFTLTLSPFFTFL